MTEFMLSLHNLLQHFTNHYLRLDNLDLLTSNWTELNWTELNWTELNWTQSQSQSYVTTDGQSASLFWCQAPIWGLRPDFYYCQTVAGLLLFGALSDERTGLPFTIAAGPRQRSHSWVWVSGDSWPYFTLSDSRPLEPGGPGPRIYISQEQGDTVIPPGTGFPFRRLLLLAGLRRRSSSELKVKVTLRLTVIQSVSLGFEHHLGLIARYLSLFHSYGPVFFGSPSLTRGQVCLLHMLLALTSLVFLGSESLWTRDHTLLSQIWDFPLRLNWTDLGFPLYRLRVDSTENTSIAQ
jgi:hypothetical protein